MKTKNDGGPAFPRIESGTNGQGQIDEVWSTDGMSLRDYFASNEDVTQLVLKVLTLNNNLTPDVQEIIRLTVSMKYAVADAMLKEREI